MFIVDPPVAGQYIGGFPVLHVFTGVPSVQVVGVTPGSGVEVGTVVGVGVAVGTLVVGVGVAIGLIWQTLGVVVLQV